MGPGHEGGTRSPRSYVKELDCCEAFSVDRVLQAGRRLYQDADGEQPPALQLRQI